ncbi:MAG: permease prefix domain 1-containing protein [Armatimonadota bacterium]|nr:permease prefix domain 1-containing protein [Armatimonadota bacterium]
MHSLLENYLAEVAAQISALPSKQCSEELREMRTHLENAVLVNRELGLSEDEAAQNAIAQFGTSAALAENVVWAWRRGETGERRSFWSIVVSLPLMLTCLLLLQNQYVGLLGHVLPPWYHEYCVKHPDSVMLLVRGLFLATFGLAGLVAGVFFPKRTVRGVCLGLVVFWIGWAAVEGMGYGGSLWRFLFRLYSDGWTQTAIFAAWAGSRSRMAWKGQGR